MEKHEFYKFTDNPELIDEQAVVMLGNLVKEYPYFYPARVLELIGKRITKSAEFEKTFKQTAALSSNRYSLFLALNPAPTEISIEKELETEHIETKAVPEPEEEKTTPGATFQLDESQSVDILNEIKEEPTSLVEVQQNSDGEVLELGDPLEPRHHKTDEEAYLDPQLYTLEVPDDFVECDSLAAAGFGRFNRDDAQSFISTERQQEPGDKEVVEMIEAIEQEVDQALLIDAFIESNPRLVPKLRPDELPEVQEDISLDSIRDPDDAISEALAAIHIAQGHNSKAILIYEKLCLKFPEKRVYFAGQIEKLRNQPDK